jgi:hypothetical protein
MGRGRTGMRWGKLNWWEELRRRIPGIDGDEVLLVAGPAGQETGEKPAHDRPGRPEKTSFNASIRATAGFIKTRTEATRYDWDTIALALCIADWRPRGWQRPWQDERGVLQFGAPDVDERFTVLFDQFRKQVYETARRTRRRIKTRSKPNKTPLNARKRAI